MINLLIIADKLLKVGAAIDVANNIIQKEGTKKAAAATRNAGRKIANKVTRTDDEGKKKFKYDKKKLSYMFSKDKISETVYDYLVSELKHIDILNKDLSNFQKLFATIIKTKDSNKLKKAIKKYEKIRDKYKI